MSVFDRFSEKTLDIIQLAKSIADEAKNEYLGAEHLLLALISDGANIFKDVDIFNDFDIINKIITDILIKTSQENFKHDDAIAFSNSGKYIIEKADQIVKKQKRRKILPEDLWIAMLENGELSTTKLLRELNYNIEFLINLFYDNIKKSPNYDDLYLDDDYNDSFPHEGEKINLENFTVNLVEAAKKHSLNKVLGREKETQRLMQIILRKTKNNPILIGDPGVGKTAIVEGLANDIANDCVPELLKGKKLLLLDLASLVAGTKYRGMFEERLKAIINEVKESKNIIIFIDELHTIVGAGASEGSLDAANILKPALSRGHVQCIGATTYEEYRKYFEKDRALDRRFQPIFIEETNKEETISILTHTKDEYESFHNVKISYEAILSAVNLSARYIVDRKLPDKAINIIDETAARINLEYNKVSTDEKNLRMNLAKIISQKKEAVTNNNFSIATQMRNLEIELIQSLKEINKTSQKNINKPIVKSSDVEKTISQITGINVEKLSKGESYKLMNLEKLLHERIKGQDDAVVAISKAIRRSRAGIQDPNRPFGSFIFLGPTGVGKTELCRALSEVLFNDEKVMIKFDMSEYMEKHSVAKLIGSPPGYVGYQEGGTLTNIVKKNPYSLILFDEIEKAHPDLFNILLQVLEDGNLTDGEGRVVNFKNTIIVMTSNAGAHDINSSNSLGFGGGETQALDYSIVKQRVMKAVNNTFKPEFLNRIDDLIIFHSLRHKDLTEIIKINLKQLEDRLSNRNIKLKFTPAIVSFILDKGYSNIYGARPLKRTIQNLIVDRISEDLILGKIKNGAVIEISVNNKQLQFKY